MPFLKSDGYKLSYETLGQGNDLLFIQGVGVHGAGWSPQTSIFSGSHRCIVFDNRGVGSSAGEVKSLSIHLMAQDALAVLETTGSKVINVVGHSLGGLVALQLALLARERVASLTLICTFANGRGAAPLTWRMVWLGMRTQLGTRAMRQRGFMRLIHPPGYAFQAADLKRMQELFGHDLASQPPVAKLQLRAMRQTDLRARLHELAGIPTLVLSARHDPIAPPSLGKEIVDGIPGAKLRIVENASHGLPITHAELTNQLMAEHLAGLT